MIAAVLGIGLATERPRIDAVDCSRFAKIAAGVRVDCGYLRVPEDRAAASSREIGVPFALVLNEHRTSGDPVIFMTGGPGGRVIPRTINPVDPSFGGRDLIFFEQRGTALSDPSLQCPGYAEEQQRAQRGEISGAKLAEGLIKFAARCARTARRSGVRLSGYSTDAIVADIEDFRVLRSYLFINLVGLSYSGKVVTGYARDHPDHIRSVVANTPLPAEANYDEEAESVMRRSLDLVIAGCEQTPACDDDHPQLASKFREVVERATRHPWRIEVDDPDDAKSKRSVLATGWVVVNALLDQLYSSRSFEALPARIDAMWSGHRKALASIVDIGKSDYSWLMRISLWCNEEVPFENPRKIAGDLHAYPEFAGVDQATVPLGLCKAAGFSPRVPARGNDAVASSVLFLIFSGQFDPATQPNLHRAMVKTLPNATIALFPWGRHGARFNGCGASLMKRFLDNPRTKLDTSCTSKEPPANFSRPY